MSREWTNDFSFVSLTVAMHKVAQGIMVNVLGICNSRMIVYKVNLQMKHDCKKLERSSLL